MSLNTKYLPEFNFIEKHSLDMLTSPEEAMTQILNYRTEDDPLFRFAISLRELPLRMCNTSKQSSTAFSFRNFTLLEQHGHDEIIYGLIGQFWKSNYGLASVVDAESFLAFQQAEHAKLVLYFSIQQLDAQHCRVSTETRVLCLDHQALVKFRPYWYLIRPVSGLIRHRILRQIQRNILAARVA